MSASPPLTDQQIRRRRKWRERHTAQRPLSWRERAEETYREILYRFLQNREDPQEAKTALEWARQEAKPLYRYWQTCEQKALNEIGAHQQAPLQKDPISVTDRWRRPATRQQPNPARFLDWVCAQSGSQQAHALIQEGSLEGQSTLIRILLSELPCPDPTFVRTVMDSDIGRDYSLLAYLADNPRLSQQGRQTMARRLIQDVVQQRNLVHANEGAAGELMVRLYSDRADLDHDLLEPLLQAACQIDEDAYMFDTEHQQASDPANAEADQTLRVLADQLEVRELRRIVQSYRDNEWAALELLDRPDPSLQTLRELALYCGSYQVRQQLLTHDKLLADPQARAGLDESQGMEVQLALMRSARGAELRRRFVELMERDGPHTLRYLRKHELVAPEDLDPELLMDALQGQEVDLRRQAIMVASQLQPQASSPPDVRSRR